MKLKDLQEEDQGWLFGEETNLTAKFEKSLLL